MKNKHWRRLMDGSTAIGIVIVGFVGIAMLVGTAMAIAKAYPTVGTLLAGMVGFAALSYVIGWVRDPEAPRGGLK